MFQAGRVNPQFRMASVGPWIRMCPSSDFYVQCLASAAQFRGVSSTRRSIHQLSTTIGRRAATPYAWPTSTGKCMRPTVNVVTPAQITGPEIAENRPTIPYNPQNSPTRSGGVSRSMSGRSALHMPPSPTPAIAATTQVRWLPTFSHPRSPAPKHPRRSGAARRAASVACRFCEQQARRSSSRCGFQQKIL
jgi:hypothetical protein